MKLKLLRRNIAEAPHELKEEPEDSDFNDSIISAYSIGEKDDNLGAVEFPNKNEVEDYDFNTSIANCSIGVKDSGLFSGCMDSYRGSKPRVRNARQQHPSPFTGPKDHSYDGVQRNIQATQPRMNLAKLGANTLWRYWSHFNLGSINPNPSEEEMVNAVQQHFASQQLDEIEVIEGFICAAKRLKTTVDAYREH